jgi:hypothetical protein
MKKIAIVGRGTVGCLSVAHYLRWTDWEIDWYYDPKIEPTPVGEGTNLTLPKNLSETLDFDSIVMDKISAIPKLGIWKRNWGSGGEFKHTFPSPYYGIHFSAVQFHDYYFDKLRSDHRVRTIETNVIDHEKIDADHVMICTGSPKNFDDYNLCETIPVNSAMIFQCPWELPKFLYTLTFAKKYGWVFGIPLKNRCAIGYIFNENFCTDEEIEDDVKDILQEFNLVPSLKRRLKFNNYVRKVNFSDRVCYNGNASFFLEPMEATSTGLAVYNNKISLSLWKIKEIDLNRANYLYTKMLNEIESMILLHYYSGSVYDNEFWKYAKNSAHEKINSDFKNKNLFSQAIKRTINSSNFHDNFSFEKETEIGTWPLRSFKQNIDGLNIREDMEKLISNYKI